MKNTFIKLRVIYYTKIIYCKIHEPLVARAASISMRACVNSAGAPRTPVRCSEVNFRSDGTIYSRLPCYNVVTMLDDE